MVVSGEGEETLAHRLQRLLKERNLTARSAARAIDCPQSTLAGWLHGATPTNFKGLKRLAEHLGVSFTYLLTGELDEPVSPVELLEPDGPPLEGLFDVKLRKVVPRPKR